MEFIDLLDEKEMRLGKSAATQSDTSVLASIILSLASIQGLDRELFTVE